MRPFFYMESKKTHKWRLKRRLNTDELSQTALMNCKDVA